MASIDKSRSRGERREVQGMTQSQFAGGTVDAPQARPEKGQLIRGFTLISALGQPIGLSDYRGRSNLVLVLTGGDSGNPELEILTEIAANYAQFRKEQAEVLAILQCDRERAVQIAHQTGLPFPLLVDEDGRIHGSTGAVDRSSHPVAAIYVTDAFGEVFAVYRAADGQTMPSAQEIVKWLTFINMQCPECGHPEWPN
jgi:peroxiredoxin